MTDISNQTQSDVNCRVFVRVRGLNSQEKSAGRSQVVQVQQNALFIGPPGAQKQMTFDWIAGPDSTQESIFEGVGKPMVDSVLSGYNGTIFAYGQTGSGKTFTMQGLLEGNVLVPEHRGLMPRTFEYIFAKMNRMKSLDLSFVCKCSFLEIYNEKITDLLNAGSSDKLQLRETFEGGVYVDGLTECVVENVDDCFKYMEIGAKNRQVRQTAKNHQSSRSHSIFTLYIQSNEKKFGMLATKASRLHLVDLAGSERQKETGTSGLSLKEASNINKALLTLGTVIRGLVDQQHGEARHIHYRDSKLTYLLKDSLGGNSKTSIIATISSASDCLAESLSTLQFAQRAKMIKNEAVVNENESIAAANELRDEVERLRGLLLASTSNERVSELEQEKQALRELNGSLSKLLDEARAIDADKENRLKTQDAKNKQLRSQLKEAKEQLVSMGNHVNDFKVAYKREKESLSENIARLQVQLKEVEETKQDEITKASEKSEQMEAAKQMLEQELSAIIACLEEERAKREEVEKSRAELTKTLEEKSAEIESLLLLKSQAEKLSIELQAAIKTVETSSAKIIELEQYIERLSSEFDELAAESGRLEGELNTLKESEASLQSSVSKLEADIKDRDSQLADLTQKLVELQEKLDSETAVFQQEMLDVKVEMAFKVDRIQQLEAAEAALTSAVAEWQSRHKSLDDEHFELLSNFGLLKNSLQVETERSKELSSNLEGKTVELASLHAELNQTVSNLREAQNEIRSLQAFVKELNDSKSDLSSQIVVLNNKIEEQSPHVEMRFKLEAEMVAYKTEIAELLIKKDEEVAHWRAEYTSRNEELFHIRNLLELREKDFRALQEKTDAQSSKIELLTKENAMLNTECEDMRTVSKKAHQENQTLTDSLKKTQENVESLTEKLKEEKKKVEVVEADLAELEAAHSHLLGEYQALSQSKDAVDSTLQKEREDFLSAEEQLKNEIDIKEKQIETLKFQLESAIGTVKYLQTEKEKLEKDSESMQADLEAQIETLKQEVFEVDMAKNLAIAEFNTEKSNHAATKEDLEGKLAQKDSELEDLNKSFEELQAEKNNVDEAYENEMRAHEEDNSNFESAIASNEEAIAILKEELESASTTIERLTQESAEKSEMLDMSSNESAAKINELFELKSNLETELQSEREGRARDNAKMSKELAEKHADLTSAQQLFHSSIDTINALNLEVEGKKIQLANLAKEKEDVANQLAKERIDHSAELQKLTADFKAKLIELNLSTETLEELKERLGMSEEERANQSMQIDQLTADRDALKAEVGVLSQQVESLQNDFDLIHSELTDVNAEKAANATELESVKAELASALDKLKDLETSNANLGIQNTELAAQREKATTELQTLQEEFSNERDALRAALDQTNSELEMIRSQMDADHEEKLNAIESAKAEAKKAVSDLSDLQRIYTQLKMENRELKAQVQSFKEEASAHQMLASVELENLQTANKKLTVALNDLQLEAKNANEKCDARNGQLVQLKKAFQELATKHTTVTDQFNALKKAKEAMEQQHAEQFQELAALRVKQAETALELDTVKRQMSQWDRFDAQHKQTGEKLEQQLETLAQRADAFRKEKESLQQQLSTQGRRLSDLEIEKEHLLSENSKLRSQLEEFGVGSNDYLEPAAHQSNPIVARHSSLSLLKSFVKTPGAAPTGPSLTDALKVKNESDSKLPQPSQAVARRFGGLRRGTEGASTVPGKENL